MQPTGGSFDRLQVISHFRDLSSQAFRLYWEGRLLGAWQEKIASLGRATAFCTDIPFLELQRVM
jgi:hypothetical protein